MKNGQLKQKVAEAMCVPEQTAEVTMRIIREAGMMTTGARGVNAPDMTHLDAARTLIAQIVEDNPGRRAIAHVKTFGPLPWWNRDFAWHDDPFTLQSLLPDAEIDTLEVALAALIRVFAELQSDPRMIAAGTRLRDGGWQKPRCTVEIFPADRFARISMGAALYDFAEPLRTRDWTPERDERFRLGRQSVSFINQEVIACIADGFRVEGKG